MVDPLPSQQRLRELLRYEPETGRLFWKLSRRKGLTGVEAGCVSGSRRYRSIAIDGKAYQAHRIVWAMHFGEEPEGILDHINGDTFDNRVTNLRIASNAENGWNRGRPNTNASGFKGVCWHSRDKRWVAYIKANGRRRHLGNFDNPEAAHAAYTKAATALHGNFARTR